MTDDTDIRHLLKRIQDLEQRMSKLETIRPNQKDDAVVSMALRIRDLLESTPSVKWSRASIGHNLLGSTRGTEYGRIRIALNRLLNQELIWIVGGTDSEPLYQWMSEADIDEL